MVFGRRKKTIMKKTHHRAEQIIRILREAEAAGQSNEEICLITTGLNRGGQSTLGKLCCGICVMTEDMKPNNLKGAVIRTLAFYLDSMFFGLVGYSSMSKSRLDQRYGDVWGKTAVVKVKALPPSSQRTPALFVLGLSAGAGCWFVMGTIGVVLKVC